MEQCWSKQQLAAENEYKTGLSTLCNSTFEFMEQCWSKQQLAAENEYKTGLKTCALFHSVSYLLFSASFVLILKSKL